MTPLPRIPAWLIAAALGQGVFPAPVESRYRAERRKQDPLDAAAQLTAAEQKRRRRALRGW